MRPILKWMVCLVLGLSLPVSTLAGPLILHDIAGKTCSIPDQKAKATVLIFIAHDCPISNSYAPKINQLSAKFAPQGIAFDLVYAEPSFTASQAKTHAAQHDYHCAVVTSDWAKLVTLTGATATPEVAVLAPSGNILYRGRIDNRYAGLGVYRPHATTDDLQNALKAIVQGKPIAVSRTQAIGCYIVTH